MKSEYEAWKESELWEKASIAGAAAERARILAIVADESKWIVDHEGGYYVDVPATVAKLKSLIESGK